MNAKSLIWGIIGTVVWLLIIFLFAVLKGYELPNSLNELGDALAGIVAPIAFFWLILGYVQQGKQLDQNTKALEQQEKALNLQITEMKESVKQQKEIAQINEKALQANFEKEKPEISYWLPNGHKSHNVYTLLLNVVNVGKGDCYNLEVYAEKVGSSRCIKNLLKAKGKASITLIVSSEDIIEISDNELLNLNQSPFIGERNSYTGFKLNLNIIFMFENVYGHKFKETIEISFPLLENYNLMVNNYKFFDS